ncbi:eukaryotic aspartyl protease family protein [Striga asiatica]|uniref:Eukaryotic aspartyl protease family protein n=1 Tax=Striga asiatica TaxID=4170 RepID=A0A5A7RIG3_STRAF|nr:eukaryotic aspartyl protease family protein [Striga asiatica]
MAVLQSFILSSFNILFYLSILLMLFSSSSNESRASETQFHTLGISSQPSATVCNSNIPDGMKNRQSSAVMEVVHSHGPCGGNSSERKGISAADILRKDQLRVESINNCRGGGAGAVRLPLISGHSLDSGSYIVTMGLGTPQIKQKLIFDTGSGLTWAQCKPCYLGCHRQKGEIFDPLKSTSYSSIPCNSSDCSASLAGDDDSSTCFSSSKCIYSYNYGDGSMTIGYLSKDTLTIASKVAVPGFMFGCSQYARGLFGLESGLVGLDRSNESLLSQTAIKFKKCFSYCLPASLSSKGFLALGKDNYDNATKFTPLILNPEFPSYYFVELMSIAVEGKKLRFNPKAFTRSGGVLVDSGTVISRLPPVVYNSLSSKIKEVMIKEYNYRTAPSYSILDTCFVRKEKDVATSVSFTFQNNVQVDLDASNTFYAVNESLICLAFAGNTDFTIFGNWQQKTFELVYDVAGERLGFRPGMCA